MLLDNFTVIAQLINFLILIWLLKRFLYGPILAAIDAREERLRAQQERARQAQKKAEERQNHYETLHAQFAEQREQLLTETRNQIDRERRQLLKDARLDIARQREQWRAGLAREQQELTSRLQQRSEETFLQTLETVLSDLTSRSLQQATVATFLDRLADLDEEQLDRLRNDSAGSRIGYEIATPWALSDREQHQLETGLQPIIGASPRHYRVAAELRCGIELRHGGHKVAWSLASHLDQLERALRELKLTGRSEDQGAS